MRRCRVCGCTDDDGCIDELTGVPCHWVAPDLCSSCAVKRFGRAREELAIVPDDDEIDAGVEFDPYPQDMQEDRWD